ncbi:MAG TPA: type II toxin-antitoxin system HicB family antitoxin, partial [Spirochaetota bacterium]|nr:type II toxin-antitoxin system HicB family antitoxin [Spirochaetota bacterium]
MKSYTYVIEHCSETDLYIGYVPGMAGAHSQAKSLDELQSNMKEVIELILEEGNLVYQSEFV